MVNKHMLPLTFIAIELFVLFLTIIILGKYQSRPIANSIKTYLSAFSFGLIKVDEEEHEKSFFAINCNLIVIFFNLFIVVVGIALKELKVL